jgi:hypothetical protein
MSADTRILYLFLASPGDLVEERKAAKEVVIEVNQEVGRNLGWQIEVLGWEDTLPGFQRPQDIINRDVDRCDLFVGMLWKRWGQPTGDGQHSSGFEEEYLRATTRRTHAALPEIWVFFKDIDPDTRADPGPQVQRVLQFRQGIEQAKRPYFQTFGGTSTWRQILRKRLIDFLFEQRKTLPIAYVTEAAQSGVTSSKTEGDQLPATQGLAAPEGRTQASASLREVVEQISKGELEFGVGASLSPEVVARLIIVASTIFRRRDAEHVLEVREANSIYSSRHGVLLTSQETLHLVRSGLADAHEFIPFFYWVKEWKVARLTTLLATLALYDGSERVRIGALRVLRRVDAKVSTERAGEIFRACQRKGGDALLIEALKFFGRFCDLKDLSLVRGYRESTNTFVKRGAVQAWVSALLRSGVGNLTNALLAEDVKLDLPRLSLSQQELLQVPIATWELAAKHADERVRHMAAQGLIAHGRIPEQLSKDSSVEVRESILRAKIRSAIPVSVSDITTAYQNAGGLLSGYVSDSSGTFRLFFETLSYDDLVSKLGWYDSTSADAYWVLAHKNFDRFGERVFSDLGDDFVSMRNAARVSMIARLGGAAALDSMYSKLEDFFFALHLEAALSAASIHDPGRALPYARKYLTPSRYSVGGAAARVLVAAGTKADIARVIDAGQDWSIASSEEVISGIVRSYPNLDVLVFDDAVPARLRSQLIHRATRSQLTGNSQRLVQAMATDDDALRSALARRTTEVTHAKQIEEVLDRYISLGYYYYAVVRMLDCARYAPAGWRKVLVEETSILDA